MHETGYAYKSPVTASYNEARLTPRSDSRQNVIVNRVETSPATRAYRHIDYWGTVVTAFDLHAPHTELEVTSASVVETEKPEPQRRSVNWDDLNSEAVQDRYPEVLAPPATRRSASASTGSAARSPRTANPTRPCRRPSSGSAAS